MTREHNFVRALIKNPKGEFFMVYNATGAGGSGEWNFPGGKGDPGEPNKAAVKRETKEEINLDLTNLKLVFETLLVWPGYRNNIPQHGYYYEAKADMSKLRFNEPDKITKAEFMSREKINRLKKPVSLAVHAYLEHLKVNRKVKWQ